MVVPGTLGIEPGSWAVVIAYAGILQPERRIFVVIIFIGICACVLPQLSWKE